MDTMVHLLHTYTYKYLEKAHLAPTELRKFGPNQLVSLGTSLKLRTEDSRAVVSNRTIDFLRLLYTFFGSKNFRIFDLHVS